MTAKAFIKQAELNRLAAVAKRHGITIEVETEHYKLRMYSTDPTDEEATTPEPNPWDIPYHQIPPEPIQPRLDHREAKALEYLMAFGAEKPIDWYRLKNFGRHTQEKLQSRGYVDVSAESDRQGNPDQIWLTKAGQKRCAPVKILGALIGPRRPTELGGDLVNGLPVESMHPLERRVPQFPVLRPRAIFHRGDQQRLRKEGTFSLQVDRRTVGGYRVKQLA